MANPINNLATARQELSLIKEKLEGLDEFLSGVERIFGSGQSAPPSTQPEAEAAAAASTSEMPSKFIDRVFQIVSEAGQPIKPKTIEREYRNRNWTLPRHNLYGAIGSSLTYLSSPQKRVLKRVPNVGYTILDAGPNHPPTEKRILRSGQSAPPSTQPEAEAAAAAPPSDMPFKFIDRVVRIVREAGKPMKATAIEEEYRNRHWTLPPKGNLYYTIAGALSYLSGSQKRALKRDPNAVYTIMDAGANHPPTEKGIFESGQSAPSNTPPEAGAPAAAPPSDMPPKFVDRVMQLVREAGTPIKTKAVEEEYRNRNWTLPDQGDLYNAIRGALSYLSGSQKRALKRDPNAAYTVIDASANNLPPENS